MKESKKMETGTAGLLLPVVLRGAIGVSGRWSEGLTARVGVSDPEVVFFPASVSAKYPVGLTQLHKLAVKAGVGGVPVWMQLKTSYERR